jgi:hypothetical protein
MTLDCWLNLRIPLVFADQGGAGTLVDRLHGRVLLLFGHRVVFDDGVVLVVKIEQVRGYPHADRIAFATITINFDSHENLLQFGVAASLTVGPE